MQYKSTARCVDFVLGDEFGMIVPFKQPTANLDALGKVEASRAIATSVQTLFQRTQGLQLYRDGMYNLCQGYLNGIFDKTDFAKKYDTLLIETVKLIELEINQTKGNIGGRQVQVPLPTLPSETGAKPAPVEKPKP